jgi:CBS domain-containing protein
MSPLCNQPDCTVGLTGRCLLNNAPDACPHRSSTMGNADLDNGGLVGAASLARRCVAPFSGGVSLGNERAVQVICSRPTHLVAIFGPPNSGKTAALVSLYLLLAHAKLSNFEFRRSKTLSSFDRLASGARRWNDGLMPEEMTAHTEQKDDRNAGFLHLRVLELPQRRVADLLIPDLPGEWSERLVDRNENHRFPFMDRADAVWIFVDGASLDDPRQRQRSIHRFHLLLRRVASLLPVDCVTPVVGVVTRKDLCRAVAGRRTHELRVDSGGSHIELSIIEVASFSADPTVPPGTGLEAVLRATLHSARVGSVALRNGTGAPRDRYELLLGRHALQG